MAASGRTPPRTSGPLTAADLIDRLELIQNPLGGWFRSVHVTDAPDSRRPPASVITYLVEAGAPIGYFHRMSAEAVHYFHQGDPLHVITISPDGEVVTAVLGHDLDAGERLQLLVPSGWWTAFDLGAGAWSLLSEAVAPAWVPGDNEDATAALYEDEVSPRRELIQRLVRP